jgi:hypothetical protein
VKVVGYLTHPLGEKVSAADNQTRNDNIANTLSWVRWFVDHTPWAICAHWLTHVMAIDDELHRPRALIDQTVLLHRSDVLIMVGGHTSPHMRLEYQYARHRKIPVLDATVLGRSPPKPRTMPPVGRSWVAWFESIVSEPIIVRVT